MKNVRTQQEFCDLAKCVTYDPFTGQIRWNKGQHKRHPVNEAGHLASDGYRKIGHRGKLFSCHRVAWYIHFGEMPPEEVDHINGNKGDNRIENLRKASREGNMQNVSIYKNNTSGFKGVYVDRGLFVATISVEKRRIYLGSFKTASQAGSAYAQAAQRYHKEFARL